MKIKKIKDKNINQNVRITVKENSIKIWLKILFIICDFIRDYYWKLFDHLLIREWDLILKLFHLTG